MSQKSWEMGLQQHGLFLSAESKVEGPWPTNSAHSLITVLAHEDILTLSGPDAVKFLQGQTTCDIQKLPEGCATLGACCTPKGRMIANFRVIKIDEEHLCLTLPKGQAAKLSTAISKYAAFYKVTLSTEHTWVRFGLSADHATITTLIESFKNTVLCLPLDEQRAEVWVTEQHSEELLEVLAEHYALMPTDVWTLLDIQQGIAWITPEFSETLLPQECNWELMEGVSFKKGCYTGQEIVARLHFRGKAKTRVQHFTLNAQQKNIAGYKVVNAEGKNCGQVVSSVFNPHTQQTHMLASVRLDQLEQTLCLDNYQSELIHQPLPYAVD